MTAKAFAPAKVNLTLHVTGKRSDGKHLLDSLVGFAQAHTIKPVPKIKRKVPHYLSEIIYKCLEKNPSDRFSSAKEIVNIIKLKF